MRTKEGGEEALGPRRDVGCPLNAIFRQALYLVRRVVGFIATPAAYHNIYNSKNLAFLPLDPTVFRYDYRFVICTVL